MCGFRVSSFSEWLSWFLISCVLVLSSGCATIIRGTSQNVRIVTYPSGKTIEYNGVRYADGDLVTIQKEFKDPKINAGTDQRPVLVSMGYNPDPWVIGDGVLLLFFLIPGAIAIGVDVATGAWREIDDPQTVYVQR